MKYTVEIDEQELEAVKSALAEYEYDSEDYHLSGATHVLGLLLAKNPQILKEFKLEHYAEDEIQQPADRELPF